MAGPRDGGPQRRGHAHQLVVRYQELPTARRPYQAVFVIESEDLEWAGYEFAVWIDPHGLVELDIRRGPGAAVLTARRLQKVPVGAIEQLARDTLREIIEAWVEENGPGAMSEWYDAFGITPDQVVGPRDFELAPLAERYVQTLGDSDQLNILEAEFKWSGESLPKIIGECRKRGLVTSTSRGKAQGQLTIKALEILGRVRPLNVPHKERAAQAGRYASLSALGRQAATGRIDQGTYKTKFAELDH
jgi:hypothetical protein